MEKNINNSVWKETVKTTLNYCEFSGFGVNQTFPCLVEAFKQSAKLRLRDQFIQKWQESISHGGKCTIYRIIKTTFGFENYLNDPPDLLRKYFTSLDADIIACPDGFRSQVLRDMRGCQFCKTDIGYEFYYLLCCVHFKEKRRKYIEAKYYIRPSTIFFQELFKQVKGERLEQLQK